MDVDYHVADEDLALAVVPGSNFNPKTRSNLAKTVEVQYVKFREISVCVKTSAKIFSVCATRANLSSCRAHLLLFYTYFKENLREKMPFS
jgi:hypothetical protein